MNRRAYLKKAGALSVSLILALHASPGGAADCPVNEGVRRLPLGDRRYREDSQGVAAGAGAVPATGVVLKRIGEVTGDDLLSAHAVIVGSPVYFGNMSGEVKTFFDSWNLKFGFQVRDRKMRNKVGGAFATGASASNGKELTMITILGAMLLNQMIVVSGGGGFGASASTGPDSPGIDEKELTEARDLGKRVAEIAAVVKRGSGQ